MKTIPQSKHKVKSIETALKMSRPYRANPDRSAYDVANDIIFSLSAIAVKIDNSPDLPSFDHLKTVRDKIHSLSQKVRGNNG